MSLSVTRKDMAPSEWVGLRESEPVGIEQVQKTLSALWCSASETLREEEEALALARLWNLVAFHSNPGRERGDSGGTADRIQALLEKVTMSLPARVIHLEEWRDEATHEPGREIEARVGTHCLRSPGGHKIVCCQEINLAGYGEKGHSHFPALVRALLAPDLPMALIWLDDVPRRGRVLGQLLGMSDRVLVDSQHTTDSASIPAVLELCEAGTGHVVDLGWLRLTPLRHLVADLFEGPGRSGQLARIESIRIESSPKGRNTGMLLLGWLLARCGYDPVQAIDLGGRKDRSSWSVTGHGRTFPVEFGIQEGDGRQDGIFVIEIRADDDTFLLKDVDPWHMTVQGPDGEIPRVPIRDAEDDELVVMGLGGRGEDPIYLEALNMTTRLVEMEQWNQ